jgi:cobalt-zinc-cadmium efflux system membrane fusion protein
MKTILQLIAAAALTMLAGCSKHDEADAHAGHDHAGHDHSKHAPAAPATDAAAQRDPKRPWCSEHNVAEDECGICHPELTAKLKPGESVKVRLPSPDSAAIAGVQAAPPTAGVTADAVECFADIAFNQTRLAQVVAPVAGIVQEVVADLGSRVEEKQVVARLWSAAIAEAIAKAVLTHQTLDRERKLRAERVTSEKDLQEAEAAHRAACQQLRTLGFTEEQVDDLGRKPQEAVLLDVRAPFAGEIVERAAVRGALVETGRPLFTIADRSTVWAMLNVAESSLGRVRVGQRVELRVDSLPGQVFAGRLTWIGASVDERTRMARARAEVANPDGLLRDKMFAQARILVGSPRSSLLLPGSAVQYVDGRPFVFVKLADDLYDARPVRVGARSNGGVHILGGLRPGEPVVVARSFAVKSQLLISRLGAGCVDD